MLHFLFNSHLEDGEKIHYVAHRHPISTIIPLMQVIFLGIAVPIFLLVLFPLFWLFALIWIGIGILRILYELADWYFDAWLLTNHSVIDVQWDGIFNRASTRIEYHTIEGVAYEFAGVLQTLLRFGDIVIQKIGTGTEIRLEEAMNPKKVETQLLKYQAKYVTDKNYKEHDALKDLLTSMLQEHAKKNR